MMQAMPAVMLGGGQPMMQAMPAAMLGAMPVAREPMMQPMMQPVAVPLPGAAAGAGPAVMLAMPDEFVCMASPPPGETDPFASWSPPRTLKGRPENGKRTYKIKGKLGSG